MLYLLRILLALTVMLPFVSCKKDDPKVALPPATQEGKNIGGCLIDGEVWKTSGRQGSIWSGPGTAAVVSKKMGQPFYNVSVILSSGESSRTIELECKNMLAPGRCEFNTTMPPASMPEPSNAHYPNGAAPGKVGDFVTGATATGWLEITYLDAQRQIIAGRFAFTGQDKSNGQQVIISEGRFDTICYYLELP